MAHKIKVDYSDVNPLDLINQNKVGLLDNTIGYNVSRYPFAYECWKRQEQIRWLPEEVPLAEDLKDWQSKLSDEEKNLLTQIMRLFAQSDIEIMCNYMYNYIPVFKPLEIQMMLGSFASEENIHLEAYALLLTSLGMPPSEFEAFLEYSAMKNKVDFMRKFTNKTCADVARTLAGLAGFGEGLSLFASFAMLLNFPRQNKLKGMGQIVTWSVRDESLHVEGLINLFHAWVKETGTFTKEVKKDIYEIAANTIKLEEKFIDLAFEMGNISGITPEEIKQYIYYIADFRLVQLKLKPYNGFFKKESGVYKQIQPHPLPWLLEILNGVEHVNFFENRATEYSKASSTGNWKDVWQRLDALYNKNSTLNRIK